MSGYLETLYDKNGKSIEVYRLGKDEELDSGDYIKSILADVSDKFEAEWCDGAEYIDPSTILLDGVENLGIF